MKLGKLFILAATAISVISCNNDDKKTPAPEAKQPGIKEENITYTSDSITLQGYVAYDSSTTGKRPAVLVVHEWWGLNDYSKRRAKQLAELGYIAMALDMYGNGQQGNDPAAAEKLAMPFYQDPQLTKKRFDAAFAKLKSYPQADAGKTAAIGYCFGGSVVLNVAKLGEDINGVVSFHGGLEGVPADKNLLKANVLVCHGGADPFVPQEQADKFKKQMDSIGAKYTFKVYEGATHAFTNPDATENGKKFNLPIAYNAAADSASWKDMKEFFNGLFK